MLGIVKKEVPIVALSVISGCAGLHLALPLKAV